MFGENLIIERVVGSKLFFLQDVMLGSVDHFRYVFIEVDLEADFVKFLLVALTIRLTEQIKQKHKDIITKY